MPTVLVFGTSGCAKANFLERLSVSSTGFFSLQLQAKGWDQLNPSGVRRQIEQQIDRACENIASKPGTYLIGLHATYLAEAFVFSPVPLSALRKLKPDLCITIFDDLYATQCRLATNGYPFSIRDILLWTRAEFLTTDLLADELIPDPREVQRKNILVSVKHPHRTLKGLISGTNRKRVYSAFSITGIVREQNKKVKSRLKEDNIEYRRRLQSLPVVVFDPGTLDDRILINKVLHLAQPETGNLKIGKEDRWPYRLGANCKSPVIDDPPNAFPIRIPHVEAFVLKTTPKTPQRPYSEIDALITQVDLRYVSQADAVTVWRPFCRGVASSGCLREVQTAAALKKPAVAYCPKEDLDMLTAESKPLAQSWPRDVPLVATAEEFWRRVQEIVA